MRFFENYVQLVKYEVLREVSKYALEGTLSKNIYKIPKTIDPGPEPRSRCCIYHERAITTERIGLALGGDKSNPNIIEVLDTACDQCPINRFKVTESCRGCIAHRCKDACPKDAISFINHRAVIDYTKCIECGKCKEACPYDAISDVMRPCKRACPTAAITIDEDKKAQIDREKCISCGACVYQCPFGAIQDKSSIVEVIELLKNAENNPDINVYATIAPAFASQFNYASIGQVVTGVKKLGFKDVVEVALGADLVSKHETEEFLNKETDVMFSSCCPAFYDYINHKYPELKDNISSTVSPMIATARLIKSIDSNAKIVFIGPCIAKKGEILREEYSDDIEFVLTFEEITALLDAAKIDLTEQNESLLNNASYYGRIFARTGGLSESIANNIGNPDFDFRPLSCDGIDECDKALRLVKFGRYDFNFIEGMACKGGCMKGPVSLHHGPKNKKMIDDYGKLAYEKNADESLRVFDTNHIDLLSKK